ncbi:hypothetical protein SAMN05443665_103340 [Actinomadura meyerae]|uniref:Uncharacterized protein n=1 Tax=Actinomadura meyerae TaxID=240840 RepID=A0A239MYU4_9ACTN|nr:hypothetical protein [Actinomadura meyerae]SNT47314.1 hypothetical protein SAMN05443665_103340 [Actinomadura meyerae]
MIRGNVVDAPGTPAPGTSGAVEGCDVKLLLLISVAVACVALSFAWREPWIGGVGLLIAFVAMFTDRDDVRTDDERGSYETTKAVRNMRRRDR